MIKLDKRAENVVIKSTREMSVGIQDLLEINVMVVIKIKKIYKNVVANDHGKEIEIEIEIENVIANETEIEIEIVIAIEIGIVIEIEIVIEIVIVIEKKNQLNQEIEMYHL